MNLFVEKSRESFEKKATMYVSEDSNKWVKEVLVAFLEEYAMLQNEPMLVEWKKKDTRKGYAVGMIKILGGAVPVVIRDFKLFPMDIFTTGNLYLPLSQEVVNMLLHSPDAFESVSNPPSAARSAPLFNPELTDSSFSPTNIGRFGSSSGLSEIRPAKTASVLDSISTVNQEDVDEIFETLNKNPHIKKAFKDNGTYEVLEKLANKPAVSTESSQENFIRNLDVDRQYVFSDKRGNTYVKQANSLIDKVWTVRIPKDEAKEHPLLTAENVIEKKATARNTAIVPIIGQDNYLAVDEAHNYNFVDSWDEKRASYIDLEESTPKPGDYGFFLGSNGATEPFVVDKSAKSYKFEKKASNEAISAVKLLGQPDKMLIFDEKSNWSVVEDNFDKKATINTTLKDSVPTLGDFGYFLTPEGATEPFEVKNMSKIANFDYIYVSGDSGFNKVAYYVVRKGVKNGIEPHETEKNAFYINQDSAFVKLGSYNDEISRSWKKYKDSLGDITVLGTPGLKVASYQLDFDSESTEIEKVGELNYIIPKNAKFIKLAEKYEEDKPIPSQHYVGRDDNGAYYFKGREFTKYAANKHNIRDLNQNDAAWTLIHCGGTVNDLKKLASLHNNEVRPIEGSIKSPKSVDKAFDLVKKAYEQSSTKLEFNKKLIKEASEFTDKTSVDAVLAMGLVNRNNIMEFLEAIPVYEQVMSSLAKLLLTARLGLAIPSDSVKRAMDNVTDVMLILRRIKATLKSVK